MQDLFIPLASLVLIVLGVSLLMRFLRQPLIIGYIIAGIIVGPLALNLIVPSQSLNSIFEISIAFLLFIVGLHLSPKVINEVGKISFITGVGKVIAMAVLAYSIALVFFSSLTAVYLALAISFSSTIIVMKQLADKDALEKLHAKIIIGFLLVQDVVAIVIHVILSSLSPASTFSIMTTLVQGVALVILIIPVNKFLLPQLSVFFARSQEFLFIVALAWGVGFASAFHYIGFSIEVGALISGIMLSLTPYNFEISSKLKPLRDFFIIAFFMILGTQIVFLDVIKNITPIIWFSVLILLGAPIIMMIIMGIAGYTKNTSFMSGIITAQVSEFSFIIIALGVRSGHLSSEMTSVIATLSLITIAGATYFTIFSDLLYRVLNKPLSIFERKNTKHLKIKSEQFPYVLLGENRIGFSIMNAFTHLKKKFLVIDYNPQVVKRLSKEGVACMYGDVSNSDLLEELRLSNARLIVSTIPDRETNLILLEIVKKRNKAVIIIVAARQISDALDFYKAGADYVILPHFLGGEYTAKIIEHAQESKEIYKKEKLKQLRELQQRMQRGHEHPAVEKDVKKFNFFKS